MATAGVEQPDLGIWVQEVLFEDYAVRGALLVGEERAVVWDTLSRPGEMGPDLRLIANRQLVAGVTRWATGDRGPDDG